MTAPIPATQTTLADQADLEAALATLVRLSQESHDGRLRDAIALVRSALHDRLDEVTA